MSDMLRDGLREGGADGRIELHGVDVIAESERHGEPRSLFWPWCAANVAVLAVSWGGYVLGMGINLAQGLLVTLFGVIASFLLVGLASLAGQKGSAPTLVLSRAVVRHPRQPAAGARVLVPADRLGDRTVLAGRPGQPDRVPTGCPTAPVRWRQRSRSWWWPAAASTSVCWLRRDHEGPAVAHPRDARAHRSATSRSRSTRCTWARRSTRPPAAQPPVIGALVMLVAGFGVGWINCAADYSRYLPRDASRSGIVGWTTFGGALPVLLLVGYGLLLCASDADLIDAFYDDPIGALTPSLPTWFLLPFIAVAILGLTAGVIIDIYSSGLTLISSGIPIQRPVAAAPGRRPDDDRRDLRRLVRAGLPRSRSRASSTRSASRWRRGAASSSPTCSCVVSGTTRSSSSTPRWMGTAWPTRSPSSSCWSEPSSGGAWSPTSAASWLDWQGYLLGPLGLGGKDGEWAFANIGVLVALAHRFPRLPRAVHTAGCAAGGREPLEPLTR